MKMENKKFSHKHYRQHYDTRSIYGYCGVKDWWTSNFEGSTEN